MFNVTLDIMCAVEMDVEWTPIEADEEWTPQSTGRDRICSVGCQLFKT